MKTLYCNQSYNIYRHPLIKCQSYYLDIIVNISLLLSSYLISQILGFFNPSVPLQVIQRVVRAGVAEEVEVNNLHSRIVFV